MTNAEENDKEECVASATSKPLHRSEGENNNRFSKENKKKGKMYIEK